MGKTNRRDSIKGQLEDAGQIIASNHAYARAKERLNWRPKTLDKMMCRAYTQGIKHKDTKGTLNKYISSLWYKHKFCNNIRIYGENIYFFCDTKLITLYRLDHSMIKHLRYYK